MHDAVTKSSDLRGREGSSQHYPFIGSGEIRIAAVASALYAGRTVLEEERGFARQPNYPCESD